MNLLARDEILSLLEQDRDIINDKDGFFHKGYDQEYTKKSHIQQCSVDLHIGKIYRPEIEDPKAGSCENPLNIEYSLKTGNTALIRTLEKVKLPADIAGICFAPSWITLKGILITNMGHVDPGYEGHLHFTVINLGKEPFPLKPEEEICTFLLIKLNRDTPSWGKEKFEKGKFIDGVEVPKLIKRSLPRLSNDFLDFEKRSMDIAKKEIQDSKFWQLTYAVGMPVVIAVIFALLAFFGPYMQNTDLENQIKGIESRINNIEHNIQMDNSLKELNEIKNKVSDLEQKWNQEKKNIKPKK